MIITRITSGLGNQLFQYAIGRSLALTTNGTLYLDLSYYQQQYATDTPRYFKLDAFGLDYVCLDTSPVQYLSKATKLLPNRTLKPLVAFVNEPHFHVDSSVLAIRAGLIILDGFWQSEQYFAIHANQIRQDLTAKPRLTPNVLAYKTAIEQAEVAVSVHIRRGDYVNHPEFSQSFGFVGLNYYHNAIQQMTSRFANATLFIFSDDPAWVADNLRVDLPSVSVISTGPDADLDDLYLMHQCQHHIIANSSFSWWGAWLNPSPDKVVIAPQNWFRNKPDWNTADLVPADWLRV
jgi:hypothetical protein